jgi:hypothetical protein
LGRAASSLFIAEQYFETKDLRDNATAIFVASRKLGAHWRRDSGQHKQAKVENAVGRFKRILGPSLRARCPDGQRVETMMGVVVLNRMLELGAPRSVPISA